jgi:hypothetical protein
MLRRAYLIAFVTAFAVTPCHTGKLVERNGSTMEKAIPLRQRGMKAVEEQMQWMMKLHGSTAMLATRDELQKSAADAVRRLKAGQKPRRTRPPQPWERATLDHVTARHLCCAPATCYLLPIQQVQAIVGSLSTINPGDVFTLSCTYPLKVALALG